MSGWWPLYIFQVTSSHALHTIHIILPKPSPTINHNAAF